MVPDIRLQIGVVIKALTDVVMPAVDTADKLAIEQAQLSIATLNLVLQRLPLERRRARRELRNAVELAEAVHAANSAVELEGAVTVARIMLADPRADEAALDSVRKRLLGKVEGAVAVSADSCAQRAVARAVVAGSLRQCNLARSFCAPAGFDPSAEDLPPLDHQLQEEDLQPPR